VIINIKEAAPSLGKTYGAVQWINSSDEKFIISSISLALCKQTYSLLKQQCPDKKVLMITSEDNYINGVYGRFAEALEEDWEVILISHVCLELSYKKDLDFSGWNLIIDEVPNNLVDILTVKQLVVDETTMLSPYLVRTDEKMIGNCIREIFRLKNGVSEQLEERLNYLKSSGSKSISGEMQGLYEYLSIGGAIQRWQEDTNLKEANYSYIKVINPLILLGSFKRVTLLAANIKTTLVGLVWNHVFKVKWQEDLNIRLRKDYLPNTDRINIYPLLPKNTNMSRYVMEKTTENGVMIFEEGLRIAEKFFEDEVFIYTVNNYRDSEIKRSGKKVPVKAHGLNSYSHIHNALILFSYNPDPLKKEILKDFATHFKLEEDTFVNGFITTNYFESSFQVSTRLSTRNHEEDTPVKIILADTRCAQYLVDTWFTDAKIHDDLRIEILDKRKNNTGRPKKSFPAMLHMDKSERTKFYNMQTKHKVKYNITSDEDVKLVKNWLINLRGANE